MLPGPVFNIELLTTSRRRRYYLVRVAYGLLLLFIIWMSYRQAFPGGGASETYSIDRLAGFAMSTFWAFAATQALTVVLLTPAIVAGVVADDRQRRTLHYLLASRLTSAEIVLGKLAAKLLHLGVFLAVGLPVISLLSLFGGVDPKMIALTYVVTASTTLFLASLTVAVSSVSKRVRDAILAAYLLALLWIAVPAIIEGMSGEWPGVYRVIGPVNKWLFATTPIYPLRPALGGLATVWTRFAWMVGLQLGVAVALIGLATARLRPSFRNEGGRRRRRARPPGEPPRDRRRRERRRLLPRPPIGDDPMLWKERHATRLGRVARVAAFLVAVCIYGGVGYLIVDQGTAGPGGTVRAGLWRRRDAP